MQWKRLLSVVGILLLYGFVMVAAGHGMGQVGLLLVMGWPQVWGLAQLPGWIGIALLLRALFVQDTVYRSLRGWSTTLLGCLLWLFAWLSDVPVLTLTTAIPFHFVWAYSVSEWFRQGAGPSPTSAVREVRLRDCKELRLKSALHGDCCRERRGHPQSVWQIQPEPIEQQGLRPSRVHHTA